MLAGETYNCLDPGLDIERQQVKRLLRLFNQAETTPEQLALLQQLLGGIGQELIIWPPFHCAYGKNIYLGNYVFLNVL